MDNVDPIEALEGLVVTGGRLSLGNALVSNGAEGLVAYFRADEGRTEFPAGHGGEIPPVVHDMAATDDWTLGPNGRFGGLFADGAEFDNDNFAPMPGDTDSDGMPDWYETTVGLTPSVDDAGADPDGLQRALGIAVALTAEPRLLLLDEPFAGMNPEETRHMMDLIRKVRESGITILLVEHDMQAVMGLCERITVVNFGQLLTEGAPQEIKSNKDVIEAYLGTGLNAA